MALRGAKGVQARFTQYVESLVSVIGHADRARPLRDYCTGLIVSEARKSVEPMAAITAPDRTGAQHQSLLHFVSQGPWSDEVVLAKIRELVLPQIERHGPKGCVADTIRRVLHLIVAHTGNLSPGGSCRF
jgi:SRSO17 transposase